METAALPAKQFPARLIFPAEAIESAPFRALYEQVRPLGDEVIDTKQGEVTFFHPGARGGRPDSLERLLVNAGLPYNLYCNTPEERETLHYWRPGMKASASTDRDVSEALSNPNFILSVRRACEELVYGQAGLAFGR